MGSGNRIAMPVLREIAEDCGFGDVRSYIQSGNLVFTTELGAAASAALLRDAIAGRTSIAPDVVVRTRDELADTVAANPFVDRADEPTQLHVVFMPDDGPASLGDVDVDAFAPDAAAAVDREIYLFLPNGMARNALVAALDRARRSTGTTRNWRTVTTLLNMADTPG